MKIHYKNLSTKSYGCYKDLKNIKPFDIRHTDAERIKSCIVNEASSLKFFYAFTPVSEDILKCFQTLSEEAQLIEKYKELLSGKIMNTGENRMVLHHLTRGRVLDSVQVFADGVEKGDFYKKELNKIKDFSEKIRSGEIKTPYGEKYEYVVQIGIGGSDLGPRALWHALSLIKKPEEQLNIHFISNVDPDDANLVLSKIDVKKTLFILVSKSGTTQETLTNGELIKKYLKEKGVNEPDLQTVVVTSESSPLSQNKNYAGIFLMDDFIGGRYSSSSAVGGLVLSLAFGFDTFKEFLEGAHEEDVYCLNSSVKENGVLLDALIGLYYRNILNYPYLAILPYSQMLNRFPAHLQQLDMESNGKSVNRFGKKISYSSGPVIFGEPGTNGQHSFYQLLHQGTDIIPLQFIGFKKNQGNLDVSVNGSTSREKLNANLVAQMVAFTYGRKNEVNLNKNFSGNRFSSLILGDILNARTLGALLSHYENKVMFQGFLWNLNSFDQEGVQLGKVLTKQILSGDSNNENLKAVMSLFS